MGFLDNTGLARVWGKIKTALGGKVDKATTVNGHALSGNVSVTKGDVGLGNVNNTSDANKPISTATQTALNGKVSTSTTVNGHALSSNVSITQQDIGIKYSSQPPSNPSDGDIWLQPESESNVLYDTDIASSAITGKSTVNAALAQLNSNVSNLNSQIGNIKNTVYVGDVITNSVPANQSTTVRSFTLPPGTYIIIGCVLYNESFQQFASTALMVGPSGIGAVRGTGANGGEGIPIVNVIELSENKIVALQALQLSATNEPLNTSTTFLKAIKLV